MLCSHGDSAPSELVVPSRNTWESTFAVAEAYPAGLGLDWPDRELVVWGRELSTDVPWHEWLALHPAVAAQLGWLPVSDPPFCWIGPDNRRRARSVRRARGQISHQPPGRAYCGEVWQVVVSRQGLTELQECFGPLIRTVEVTRTLPARPREGRLKDVQTRGRVVIDST